MANNPPSKQTIHSFYNTAAKKDFARVFQFRLMSFGNVDFGAQEEKSGLVYVETASLPGRTINVTQVPYMGLQFNVPGTVSYPGSNSYAVTFRCDQNYDIRKTLEAATFGMFDESTSQGAYGLPGGTDTENTLTMALLGKDLAPVRYYTLFGAYVAALQDAQYDIKDTGTVATVQATLAYQFWRAGDSPNLKADQRTDITVNSGRVKAPAWAK